MVLLELLLEENLLLLLLCLLTGSLSSTSASSDSQCELSSIDIFTSAFVLPPNEILMLPYSESLVLLFGREFDPE